LFVAFYHILLLLVQLCCCQDCVIPLDGAGRSKGFGFVEVRCSTLLPLPPPLLLLLLRPPCHWQHLTAQL
jgi:hypothetical protein